MNCCDSMNPDYELQFGDLLPDGSLPIGTVFIDPTPQQISPWVWVGIGLGITWLVSKSK